MTAGTEVELYKPGQIVAFNHETEQITEALTLNLGGAEPSKFMLDQATVPGPGGKRWKVSSADGDETDPESLTGVIIAIEPARSYWKKKYESGGDTPDCASYDGGLTGTALSPDGPGMTCAACPMNEFGSGPEGRGKACREMKHLLLLTDGDPFPVLVRIPPTSLKIFNGFMFKQAKRALPYYAFAVELGIGRTNTQTRTDVPCVAPKFLGTLSDEELVMAKAYRDKLTEIFARNAMNPNGTDPNGTDPDPAAAPAATGFAERETDEERAERLAERYGDTIPTGEEA